MRLGVTFASPRTAHGAANLPARHLSISHFSEPVGFLRTRNAFRKKRGHGFEQQPERRAGAVEFRTAFFA